MSQWKRRITQLLVALLSNSYLSGWQKGTIYQGKLKSVCVPFLNCYSCPGALGACPVGAFQSLASSISRRVSLYVLGLVIAAGAVGGRFVCGWLCPFGLMQELLFMLSQVRRSIPRWLTKTKYLVLTATAALPFIWRPLLGMAEPFFCKYVCPAGTLEAGVPLILMDRRLADMIGGLFAWKMLILVLLAIWAIFSWRPFCRTLCPLGAAYSLFNAHSIWRMRITQERCTQCGICSRRCPAELRPAWQPNHAECVRCLRCADACPRGALVFGPEPKPSATKSARHSA